MNSFNSALNWGTKYTQKVPIELDNSFDFPYDYITFAYYTTHCVDKGKFPIQSWINFYELLSVIHFSTKRRLRTFLTLHISLSCSPAQSVLFVLKLIVSHFSFTLKYTQNRNCFVINDSCTRFIHIYLSLSLYQSNKQTGRNK